MARVTVEDCVLRVPNRFELVLLAAHRARAISTGAPLTLDRDNDKNPVVALREIADETVGTRALRDGLIGTLQHHVENDEPVEDEMPRLMTGSEGLMEMGGEAYVQSPEDLEAELEQAFGVGTSEEIEAGGQD